MPQHDYVKCRKCECDLENGTTVTRSPRRSRLQKYIPCFNLKDGCYVFLFFAAVKLLAVIVLVFIGKNHAPTGLINRMGLCAEEEDSQASFSSPSLGSVQATSAATNRITSDGSDLTSLLANLPGVKDESDIKKSYRPRILCMIFTTPSSWRTKARAVNETWARRCDVHKFFYSGQEDVNIPTLDAIALSVPEGRGHLTAKTMVALRTVYQEYSNKVDWYLKADDDTYMIMENLRRILSSFDPDKPHYVGGRSMDLLEHGYNGGGAGYALSSGAARQVVEEGHNYPQQCKQDGGVEDLDMGNCLAAFKTYPTYTADNMQRLTFHPDHPYKIFANIGDNRRVYTYTTKDGSKHGNPNGIRVMSPFMASFHYMEPGHMYMYDFLLYDINRDTTLIAPQDVQEKDVTYL